MELSHARPKMLCHHFLSPYTLYSKILTAIFEGDPKQNYMAVISDRNITI